MLVCLSFNFFESKYLYYSTLHKLFEIPLYIPNLWVTIQWCKNQCLLEYTLKLRKGEKLALEHKTDNWLFIYAYFHTYKSPLVLKLEKHDGFRKTFQIAKWQIRFHLEKTLNMKYLIAILKTSFVGKMLPTNMYQVFNSFDSMDIFHPTKLWTAFSLRATIFLIQERKIIVLKI